MNSWLVVIKKNMAYILKKSFLHLIIIRGREATRRIAAKLWDERNIFSWVNVVRMDIHIGVFN